MLYHDHEFLLYTLCAPFAMLCYKVTADRKFQHRLNPPDKLIPSFGPSIWATSATPFHGPYSSTH